MNSLTLYELSAEYREAAQTLSELDADEQTLADTLEGLRYPMEQKARNVALVVGNLEALADSAKEASAKLAERAKRVQARADWLRKYLLHNMQAAGITKIEPTADLPYFKIALQNNPVSVVILDPALVPSGYLREPAPPPAEPDKKLIAQALKDGYDVPGCELRQSQRLVIK